MNKQITDEDLAKVNSMGYTLDQALTLASIIQSEASDPENMPMVSSVFANRLKPGSGFGYLGSDVTRHYIEREMSQPSSRAASRASAPSSSQTSSLPSVYLLSSNSFSRFFLVSR